MSSNDYHSYNSTLDDYNSALRCLKIKSYQRALIYLESLLEKDPYNLDGYLLKGQCELNLNNEGDAIKNVNQGLKIIESNHKEDDEFLIMKIKLLQMRSQIYEKLEIPEKAALDINEIKLILKEKDKNGRIYAGLQQDFPFANGHGIDNQENGIIKDENGEHNQEAQIVYELFQKSSENEMLTTEFSIVHVVSMKWFEKWKTYTNFSMEMTNSPIKSRNSKDMLEEEIERQHPGPIISDDIIDKEAEVLFDPDPVREYCNIVLKEGITENKDFIIFPHPVWKYLHSLYTGQDIKRFVTCLNDETEQTIVEVWLKKINVLVAPPISKNQKYVQCEVKTLYISKKETVKELRQKITRIFKTMSNIPDREVFENCRLWKLDPKKNFKQLLKTAGGTKESVILKGSRLTDGVCLEDTELGDTDIVICEYKVGKTWKFISEEEHLQIVLSHCGYCGANHENLLFCECKTIKYCNSSCQKSHRAQHKEDCLKAKAKLNKDHQIIKQFKLKNTKFGPNSRYGVCGLQNLGNTCFMNSSLQCLSNISELTYYFLENRFVKDLNKHNRLGTGGRLAAAYAELMKELWHGSDSYVSPWHIKKIIAEVASQFSGYSQHDAGEFLSYLIDGLHEDLNKVVDKPYIEAPEVENQPDEIAAKKSWENHMKRNESIIVDQLHGQFKSKLICPDCNKISITFDPFMTLSLPIPHVNTIPVTLYFIYKNNKVLPVKITLNIDPTAPSTTIVEKTAQRISLPEQALELIFIKEQTFMRMKFSDYDIKAIKEEDGALFVYQTHSPDIDGPLEEFNKEDKIKVELEMLGYASNHLSFSRLLYIPRDITLKQLHLHIYYIMRGYLAPIIAQDSMLFPFTIDLEKTDPETLESEYHAFQGLGNNAAKITPYKLVYIDIIRDQQTLPYQEERLLSDEITIRNPLTLGVVFNREFATDLIKLNKCHDLEENNSVSKDPKSYSIIDCLNLFTTPEVLDQENLWYCGQCKQHKQATKKMDIYKLPKVLIVHLKRFKTSRVHSIGSYFFTGGSSKITALVEFPVENLDLRPYTLGKWDEPPIYDLFAITNHYGNLGGGHYTAYVKNQQKNAWLDYNDSNVSTQDADDLVSPAAYLLFYKRREVERQPEARPENRE